MLASSLGAETLTSVICTCSALPVHSPQTIATLKFGDVAHSVQVRAKVRAFVRSQQGVKIKAQAEESSVSLAESAQRATQQAVDEGASLPLSADRFVIDTRVGKIMALQMVAGGITRSSTGTNYVVICLQGFGNGCGIAEFESDLMPIVARRFPGVPVYSIDFPGFGDSPGVRQTSRTERLWEAKGPMDVLVDVMEHVTNRDRKHTKVVLLGWDWGGNMALSMALSAYKSRIAALALTMPSWTSSIDDLAGIGIPVLLVWLPSDQMHLYSAGKRMARVIKKSKLVTLVWPAGKDVNYELVGSTSAQQCADWLSSIITTRRPAVSPPPQTTTTTVTASPVAPKAPVGSDSDDDDDDATSAMGDDDDEDSFSTQSSFLAMLLADPIAAEEVVAAERRAKEDAKQKRREAAAVAQQQRPMFAAAPGDSASIVTLANMLQEMRSNPSARQQFRDALLGRAGGNKSQLFGALRGLRPLLPFTAATAFVARSLWRAEPRGSQALRCFPTFPAGRQVLVELPNVIADFRSPYFGFMWESTSPCPWATRRHLSYRPTISGQQNSGADLCTLNVPVITDRSASNVYTKQIDVPWRSVIEWNAATNFPLMSTKTSVTIFDDAIQSRYADLVTVVKIHECALAVAPLVERMDFEAAINDRLTANDTGANKRLLDVQVACVSAIRGCQDMIHHVSMGKDPQRLCVPDCGRLATFGQWHCHGMASVMASLLLPFSTALGIDVRLVDGYFCREKYRDSGPDWNGVPLRQADHTWLELTFFPSGVSAVCDPSFTGSEAPIVPLEVGYSFDGCRFPMRRFTGRTGQLQMARGIPECDDCLAPHDGAPVASEGVLQYPAWTFAL